MPPESNVTSLILMRHGETAWNRERRVMGSSDVPLSESGRRQCEHAADVLVHFEVDRVVSSPLARALESAEIVGERIGAPIETNDDLQEVRFGSWEGKTYDEIIKDPRYALFLSDPVAHRTPGGESIRDVQNRGLAALRTAGVGERVLFISHGDVIRSTITYFLAIPVKEFRRIRVDNCGLTAVTICDERPEVKFVNMLADPERAWDPLHWSTRT